VNGYAWCGVEDVLWHDAEAVYGVAVVMWDGGGTGAEAEGLCIYGSTDINGLGLTIVEASSISSVLGYAENTA
jgi:hypothetical protein